MLAGRAPFGPAIGTVTKISCQTRVDGWLLDDLLVTLETRTGDARIAFSIKDRSLASNRALVSEFARDSWLQFLGSVGNFDTERDFLALSVPRSGSAIERDLDELTQLAGVHGNELEQRLRTQYFASREKTRLWKQFRCPPELTASESQADIGKLLARVRFVPFDFAHSVSRDHDAAIAICRDILLSSSTDEAADLWQALREIADETRPRAGSYTSVTLLPKLVGRFAFRDLPYFTHDWDQLRRFSQTASARIHTTIAGRLTLPRQALLEDLEKAVTETRAAVALGPSGCGKSAAIRLFAQQHEKRAMTLWIPASTLDERDFMAVQRRLGVVHPIADVLNAVSRPQAYLFVDGVERLASPASFDNLRSLLQSVNVNEPLSPWRIVLTCQPEEWNKVQARLLGDGLPASWVPVVVRDLARTDLEPVWAAFPQLKRLRLLHHLQPLLRSPKVVDVLATGALVEATEFDHWIGESDLIKWFWATRVAAGEDGRQRSAFLQQLAESQADSLVADTPISTLAISDLSPLDGLTRDGLCSVIDERIRFGHDLYGDWARERCLRSHLPAVATYLKERSASPLWNRAVRLFGLHLLETSTSASPLTAVVSALSLNTAKDDLIQDLVLEGIVLAADPDGLLERVWPDLETDQGRLLRRFLVRFLHFATLPNPMMLSLANQTGNASEVVVSTEGRLPYWPYWLPVLRFLRAHAEAVARLAPVHVAEISDVWLRRGRTTWPLRPETAELALKIAEEIADFKRDGGVLLGDVRLDDKAYRAALAAAREYPDRVRELALRLAGRAPGSTTAQPEPRRRRGGTRFKRLADRPRSWPDGPRTEADHHFRDIALTTDALTELIEHDPSAVIEVTLALLIDSPDEDDYSSARDGLGLIDVHEWSPTTFLTGPFYALLKQHPKHGIDLVVRLTNFAVDRMTARDPDAAPYVLIQTRAGTKRWFAYASVYAWFRDNPLAPNAVVAALMALEKWLYDEIDAGHDVTSWIQTIFERGNSIAFAGLLVAVGKRYPVLFRQSLSPLLAVSEIYRWDLELSLQRVPRIVMPWSNLGPLQKIVDDFHDMPHKNIPLDFITRQLLLNDGAIRELFDVIRSLWNEELASIADTPWRCETLEDLISQYDPSNYRVVPDPAGGEAWSFEPPAELRLRWTTKLESIEVPQMLLSFPFECRRRLDAGEALNADGLIRHWQTIERLETVTRPSDFEAGLGEPVDAICGGLAVVFRLHRSWLRQFPDREKWAMKFLLDTILSPPPQSSVDSRGSAYSGHWDSFCSEALPVLWAEDRTSLPLRRAIARLAHAYHDDAVRRLFESAASIRAALGDDFLRLQHLAVILAAARGSIAWVRDDDEATNTLHNWIETAAQDFVSGHLSPTIRWPEISGKAHQICSSRGIHNVRGLDIHYLQHAFAWLPSLHHAANAEERSSWLAVWLELLNQSLSSIRPPRGDEWESQSLPNGFDYWLLSRIPDLILQLRVDEQSERFWMPLLDRGVTAHHWIEIFLRSWFRQGLAEHSTSNRFIPSWKAMLAFAFGSANWNLGRGWFKAEELWCGIMGLDFGMADLWRESQRKTVIEMTPVLERWADAFAAHPRCAQRLARFLHTDAATVVLPQGLGWLRSGSKKAERFWDERGMTDVVAELLEVSWRMREPIVRSTAESFEAYKALLRDCAARQNRVALELQARLASTSAFHRLHEQ